MPEDTPARGDTSGPGYTERLVTLEASGWKRWVDVQAPYRRKLRSVIGNRRTLDVGCGIGRNLRNLPPGSVGVDHNHASITTCRERGLTAYHSSELPTPDHGQFEGLVAAHVVEHMSRAEALELIHHYLGWLQPGARVVLVCPQERGYASDSTHVEFVDAEALRAICRDLGLADVSVDSFPCPRFAGRVFTYNEFWAIGTHVAG